MNKIFLLLVLFALSLSAQSDDSGSNDTREALDLKFPDVKTGIDFQLSAAPVQQTLLVFWRTDCEPCLKDMPLISDFAVQHTEWRVLGISLSDKKSSLQFLDKQQIKLTTLINNDFPGELLKRFGNSHGAVPYTVMLRADRSLCWSAMGQITEEQLQQGLEHCRKG